MIEVAGIVDREVKHRNSDQQDKGT